MVKPPSNVFVLAVPFVVLEFSRSDDKHEKDDEDD